MNAPPLIAKPRRPWFLLVLFLPALLFTGVTLGILSCFRVSGETAALRRAILQSVDGSRRIEASVGPVILGLTRLGLRFAPVDEEARLAIQSVRGAEVSVYHLDHPLRPAEAAKLAADSEQLMSKRGWDRIVTVANDDALVLVHVPRKGLSPDNVKFCVAVVNEQDLVLVSGRGDLEPMQELILRHASDWKPRVAARTE